ncbi:MAG: cysteine desulfurase family protein [Bacillota bacterium]|nr:cysteine desulfurase family protein [Bacillota bacterium]
MRKLYLDYSASTPVKPEVFDFVREYLTDSFGNASSLHSFGVKNKDALFRARKSFAKAINAGSSEIYFTSGGSEADNWALKGVAEAYGEKGKHIITTKIEHPAILQTAQHLERLGYELTYLSVDEHGLISLEELRDCIREDTILVSVIFVNNEIGTVQDIQAIGNLCRERKVLFHSDAVQAFSNVKIDVKALPVDLLSFSAHKFYALKGCGALYVRQGVKLGCLLDGGSQEMGMRAGTENIPAIVAMGKAAELATAQLEEHIQKLTALRDYTVKRVLEEIPHARYNGHPTERHPGILHFSFRNVNANALLIALDRLGIAVSAGSACSSGSLKASHVLRAIGLPDEWALGSVRISMGDFTEREDCDYLVDSLKKVIEKIFSK